MPLRRRRELARLRGLQLRGLVNSGTKINVNENVDVTDFAGRILPEGVTVVRDLIVGFLKMDGSDRVAGRAVTMETRGAEYVVQIPAMLHGAQLSGHVLRTQHASSRDRPIVPSANLLPCALTITHLVHRLKPYRKALPTRPKDYKQEFSKSYADHELESRKSIFEAGVWG